MSKVTQEDISALLNISKNTVSKALRGAPGVSDELRKKIITLAEDMGYNKISLTKNNMIKNISVVCRKTFFADVTFWPHVFYGISHYASEHNFKLSIINIEEDMDDKPKTFTSITNHPSDGYIIVGSISDELLRKLKATNLPLVIIDHFSEETDCDYINSSNKIGIYRALKHLYENNHRNIGFVSNSISAYSFIERYEAYLKYMKSFNLKINEEFLWLDGCYIKTDYFNNKILATRDHKDFPTAWICVNDTTAITFMNALTSMGIRVPDDVSIVGYDNISELLYPGLTTIDVPKQTMGQRAMEQLLSRIKNPEAPYENIVINTTLVERNSVKNLEEISEKKRTVNY